MSVSIKVQVIAIIILGVSSFIWFLLGVTAGFQRGMDIIGSTLLTFVAIPLLLLVGGITSTLVKQWNQTSDTDNNKLYLGLAIVTILSLYLFANISSNSWTKETKESDTLQITADGKYKYRIELVNLFQRNSSARLFIRDTITGDKKEIKMAIPTKKIDGIEIPFEEEFYWVKMEPTKSLNHYFLYTTEDLGIQKVQFEVDVKKGVSRRLK